MWEIAEWSGIAKHAIGWLMMRSEEVFWAMLFAVAVITLVGQRKPLPCPEPRPVEVRVVRKQEAWRYVANGAWRRYQYEQQRKGER